MSPFTRCLQTAAEVARKIFEKVEEEEEEMVAAKAATEEEEAAATKDNGTSTSTRRRRRRRPLVIEVDVSVCEVLSRGCLGGEDPPDGPDPRLWAWGGGSGSGEGGEEASEDTLGRRLLSAAAAAGLPSDLTSLASSPRFATYPETQEEAGTRYLVALASAAARALAVSGKAGEEGGEEEEEEDGGDGGNCSGARSENPEKKKKKKKLKEALDVPTTMVVTHGEAVVAATRMAASPKGKPYAVPPTGVVVLDVFVDEDEEDEGGDCDCADGGGEEERNSDAASAVACARWELSQAARGVAFE